MQFFLMFLQMAPAIIQLVKQVEDAIPGKGKGKEKLDVVLNAVNTGVQTSVEVKKAVDGNDLNGAVTSLVNGTVAVMNATGTFTK